jgi:hypothetical protein
MFRQQTDYKGLSEVLYGRQIIMEIYGLLEHSIYAEQLLSYLFIYLFSLVISTITKKVFKYE